MSSTQPLLKIDYHDDDDTGMYHVGEVDFGIHGTLDDFLRSFGFEGKKNLVATLGYLIYEVERRYRENTPQPSTNQASAS